LRRNGDRDDAPVGELHRLSLDLAVFVELRHRAVRIVDERAAGTDQLGNELVGVPAERARRLSQTQQVTQAAAGLHAAGRQTVHLKEALVVEHEAAIHIEQQEPLRHVVERRIVAKLPARKLAADAPDIGETNNAQCGGGDQKADAEHLRAAVDERACGRPRRKQEEKREICGGANGNAPRLGRGRGRRRPDRRAGSCGGCRILFALY